MEQKNKRKKTNFCVHMVDCRSCGGWDWRQGSTILFLLNATFILLFVYFFRPVPVLSLWFDLEMWLCVRVIVP